nr:MAG TPA: hypothetical protein [Caudoviricetes sp.]
MGQWPTFLAQWATFGPPLVGNVCRGISTKSRCCPIWPTYFSIKLN